MSFAETKQVPRRIADLWESRSVAGQTSHNNLFATYVAYTATPQANLLQDPTNLLSPKDFAISLRTPGADGALNPRSTSYRDPAGLRSWYTGGDLFYRSLSSVPLCRTEDDPDEVFANALRSFLVSSAIRLWRTEPRRIGPRSALEHRLSSAAEAADRFAAPASMLIHPSAATEEHFDVAAEVLAWADGELDQAEARARIAAGVRSLSAEGIRRQLAEEPEKWIYWIQDFAKAAQVCYTELALPSRPRVPDASHWEEIAEIISNEVVPGTRLAVINSKEGADDRPDFEPQATTTGWGPPPNHSTIFVSGNVMARGLTLEGLTTTLFTRDSASPLADTQMQMQRWFGYRGSFIELCRVFLHPQQLELFARYHEADEALRRDILTAMETAGPASALTVLQGSSFVATGKLTNVSSSPLAPRATPFVRHMNDPEAPEERTNAELVATTFSETEVDVVRAQDGRDIGLIVANDLALLSTAELLDQLRYSDHGPGGAGAESDRWNSVASHPGLTNSDPEFPLYRAPIVDNGVDLANDSPYWIAAYLRTWAACLTRRAVGLTTTDPPYGPWSLVDLERRSRSAEFPNRSSLRQRICRHQGPAIEGWPHRSNNG